jgi:hypothetical protein
MTRRPITARKRRRKFTLRRFWARLRLPFVEVGAEWKRKPSVRRRAPSRKQIEARVRAELVSEQKASETPMDQMLQEIEDASARKFRGALRRGEPGEIGTYGVIRLIAGNERRRRRGQPPSNEQQYW